jgi:hypothetical protein
MSAQRKAQGSCHTLVRQSANPSEPRSTHCMPVSVAWPTRHGVAAPSTAFLGMHAATEGCGPVHTPGTPQHASRFQSEPQGVGGKMRAVVAASCRATKGQRRAAKAWLTTQMCAKYQGQSGNPARATRQLANTKKRKKMSWPLPTTDSSSRRPLVPSPACSRPRLLTVCAQTRDRC